MRSRRIHLITRKRFSRTLSPDYLRNRALTATFTYGLVAREPSFILEKHVNALIRTLKFHYKRKKSFGSFTINFSFNRCLTVKPVGVRMGKGKGAPADKVFFLRKGFLYLTITDKNSIKAHYIAKKCSRRMPVTSKVIDFSG